MNIHSLIGAIKTKNDKEVMRILSSDPNSHRWITSGELTPLHYAAEHCENEKIIDFLLEKGANVEATDWWLRKTPLHFAAEKSEKIVKLLLENGANIEAKDKNEWTPLYIALRAGKDQIVKLLIEMGANINAMSKGSTPLHCAASYSRDANVKLLLEKGANIHAKNKSGSTSLHCAALSGKEENVKLLLEKGAKIEAKDKYEWTPLHCASSCGKDKIVKLLLEKGANIHAEDKDGSTPLHFASRSSQTTVKLLLEKGANIEAKNKNLGTPLHCACTNRQNGVQIAELLLEKGAHIDAKKGDDEQTPLHFASKQGKDEIVKLLLGKGAAVDAKDKNLWTPLHCACTNRQNGDQIAELLLEKGANTEARNNHGSTPSQHALSQNNRKTALIIVRYLPLSDQMHASRNTIEQMKGFELKEELEERRLLSTGLKADLIQRLMQNEVQRINKAIEENQNQKEQEHTKKRKETNSPSLSSQKRRKTSSPSSFSSSSSSSSSSPSSSSSFPSSSPSSSPSTSRLSSVSSSTFPSLSPSTPPFSLPSSLPLPSRSASSIPSPPSTSFSSPSSLPSSSSLLSTSNIIVFESSNVPPPSRCFNHSPKLNFEDSVRALLLGFEGEKPQNIGGLSIASEDDVNCLINRCKRVLRAKRCCPETKTVVEKMGENSALAIIAYTCEDPYPLHKWLNVWLRQKQKDLKVRENVGPFFRLFYQGLENLPKHNKQAFQQIQILPEASFFRNVYDHPPEDGSEMAFWGAISFEEGDCVETEEEKERKGIVYRCANLNCVSLECLAIGERGGGEEVMPLPPAMFRVVGSEKGQSKLMIHLEHITEEHYFDAYVQPSSS